VGIHQSFLEEAAPLELNLVYRAYCAPYAWVPQLAVPRETAVQRLDVTTFRVPGAAPPGRERVVEIVNGEGSEGALCVAAEDASASPLGHAAEG
jgi:hypothetical protein